MSETNPKLNFTHESCSDTGCITFYVNGEEITDWYQETDAENCQKEFKRIYMAGYNKALAQKDAEIAELERELRDIKKPQFWLSGGSDFCGGHFHCNHCDFSSNLFAKRDEHAKTCAKRQAYLNGEDV